MTALGTTLASGGIPTGTSLGEAVKRADTVQRAAAFDEALGRSTADAVRPEIAPAATANPASAPTRPGDVPYENSASSKERVRKSLELDGVAKTTDGDAILGGLQRLRGVFDSQHSRIGEIMRSPSVDSRTLLSMQMEVAQYSVLVDISSKLTGKSTQLFDTLMKGQ